MADPALSEAHLVAAFTALQQADQGAEEALRVVLSTATPGRFKLLTVLCPQGDALARVYQTARGTVYVAEKGQSTNNVYRHRALAALGRLESLEEVAALGFDADLFQLFAACRHRSAEIPLTWLRDQITAAARRVVLADSDAVVTSHV